MLRGHIRARNREAVREYLTTHPCVDCGESDPIVLVFDHLSDKTMNVSRMSAKGYGLNRILQEISKCEVRCANCHQRITYKRSVSSLVD